MANWNIKKKNGQNVMFNDNPRTRTTENYTQNNFIERNTTVNGIPTNIPGYIIGQQISLAILSEDIQLLNTELLMILNHPKKKWKKKTKEQFEDFLYYCYYFSLQEC